MEKYIKETIESVFKQNYTDYEIVVVDDGSTDNSRKILEQYEGRIRYVYQENRGVAAALNTGIRISKGKYLAILGGDDVWLPDYLQKMVNLIEKEEDTALSYSNAFILENEKIIEKSWMEIFIPPSQVNFINLLRDNFISGMAVFRKEIIENCGLYDENFYIWFEDVDLCYRMRRDGWKLYYLSEVLVTHYGGKSFELWNEEKKILRFYLSLFYYFKKNHNILKAYSIKIIILLNFILNILFSSVKQFLLPTPERNEYILFSKNLVKKLLTESSSSCING